MEQVSIRTESNAKTFAKNTDQAVTITFYPRIESNNTLQLEFTAPWQVTSNIIPFDLTIEQTMDTLVTWMVMKNGQREQATLGFAKQMPIKRGTR